MSKEEFRFALRWLVFVAALILICAFFHHGDFHGPSRPVWKSFTVQDAPAARH